MERFGFVLHPISYSDISRKFGKMANILPKSLVLSTMKHLGPQEVSHITGIKSAANKEAEGWFTACTLTTEQMMSLPEDFVIKKVIDAVNLAAEKGAKIVGLGAYTAVVGDAGLTIARNVDVPVTTGNSYTVATALLGLDWAAKRLGTDLKNRRVGVMGAYGSIGKACSRILAGHVGELVLIGRKKDALALLQEELSSKGLVTIATDSHAVLPTLDALVTVTSAIDSVIEPEDLKTGAIVCDVARPRDVSKKVAEVRDDVLVFEGGAVLVPGDVDFNFNFGFPKKTSYACMAETMILALEQRYENYTLGRDLDVDKVEEMIKLADKHGFKLAGLRSFERAIDDKEILKLRQIIEDKSASA
ncbi:MAG TPA: shikimate dehydrogenase [Firmicutes bacterium]|nr:shikimate dehydrogenase [Bacillota bacterium]